MFVTFEGIDGCGKTTVAKRVVEILADRGANVGYYKTPGHTEIGAQLRQLVLNPEIPLAQNVPFYLFMADMLQIVHECRLDTSIEDNKIVICDRFKDSTFVYQVLTSSNISIREASLMATLLRDVIPDPDVTVLFDVDYDTAQSRLATDEFSKKDRFEAADRVKWEKRRTGYQRLPIMFPERKFISLDVSTMSAEEVSQKVLESLFLD